LIYEKEGSFGYQLMDGVDVNVELVEVVSTNFGFVDRLLQLH
jgi:hypothetical protein